MQPRRDEAADAEHRGVAEADLADVAAIQFQASAPETMRNVSATRFVVYDREAPARQGATASAATQTAKTRGRGPRADDGGGRTARVHPSTRWPKRPPGAARARARA